MDTLKTSLVYAFIFGCLMLAGALAYEIFRPTDKLLLTPVPDTYNRSTYPVPSPARAPRPRIELISTSPEPTKAEILQEIERVFGDAAPTAKLVAKCESGLRASVVSKTSDTGIFQISWVHKIPKETLKDYKFNIQFAHKLYSRSGWAPWKYSRKCWAAQKGV